MVCEELVMGMGSFVVRRSSLMCCMRRPCEFDQVRAARL